MRYRTRSIRALIHHRGAQCRRVHTSRRPSRRRRSRSRYRGSTSGSAGAAYSDIVLGSRRGRAVPVHLRAIVVRPRVPVHPPHDGGRGRTHEQLGRVHRAALRVLDLQSESRPVTVSGPPRIAAHVRYHAGELERWDRERRWRHSRAADVAGPTSISARRTATPDSRVVSPARDPTSCCAPDSRSASAADSDGG
jgi:hypothetical protein